MNCNRNIRLETLNFQITSWKCNFQSCFLLNDVNYLFRFPAFCILIFPKLGDVFQCCWKSWKNPAVSTRRREVLAILLPDVQKRGWTTLTIFIIAQMSSIVTEKRFKSLVKMQTIKMEFLFFLLSRFMSLTTFQYFRNLRRYCCPL